MACWSLPLRITWLKRISKQLIMKILRDTNLSRVLFIDIETVPSVADFSDLPDYIAELWDKKSGYFRKEEESPADVFNRAGIYAEFGKIICISAGFLPCIIQN